MRGVQLLQAQLALPVSRVSREGGSHAPLLYTEGLVVGEQVVDDTAGRKTTTNTVKPLIKDSPKGGKSPNKAYANFKLSIASYNIYHEDRSPNKIMTIQKHMLCRNDLDPLNKGQAFYTHHVRTSEEDKIS